MLRHPVRVATFVLALALVPLESKAEEARYLGLAGAGVVTQVGRDGVTLAPNILLKSVIAVSDRWQLDGPLLIDLGDEISFTVGGGIARVLYLSNHWRWNAGAGVMVRMPTGESEVMVGPYAETAVRWLIWWGVGASVELHVAFFDPTDARTLYAAPSLAVYQEFW